MKNYTFKGVIPALMTAFDNKGSIDLKALENHVEYLINKGVGGLYLTGSTGEGFLMDAPERNEVIQTVVQKVAKRVPLIAHTGAISTQQAIALSQAAEQAGVDAISSVPPFYYGFSQAEIISFYRDLASSTSLPFFVYNIPATTGIDLSITLLDELFNIENIIGLKYTSGDIFTMEQIINLPNKPITFSGSDEMSFYGLWAGASAIVGSSYNLLADVNASMIEHFNEGDFKQSHRQYQLSSALLATLLKFPYFAAVRTVLQWEGCDIGMPRKPFQGLTKEDAQSLRKQLKDVIDQFPLCKTSLRSTLA